MVRSDLKDLVKRPVGSVNELWFKYKKKHAAWRMLVDNNIGKATKTS
jgi:hypothetical protein